MERTSGTLLRKLRVLELLRRYRSAVYRQPPRSRPHRERESAMYKQELSPNVLAQPKRSGTAGTVGAAINISIRPVRSLPAPSTQATQAIARGDKGVYFLRARRPE